MLLALIMLGCASGRQVVERKMLRKLQEEALLDKRLSGNLNKVTLPVEEKSTYWTLAVKLYTAALPFYLMCIILFYYPPMTKDIACELVLLNCLSLKPTNSIKK